MVRAKLWAEHFPQCLTPPDLTAFFFSPISFPRIFFSSIPSCRVASADHESLLTSMPFFYNFSSSFTTSIVRLCCSVSRANGRWERWARNPSTDFATSSSHVILIAVQRRITPNHPALLNGRTADTDTYTINNCLEKQLGFQHC